MHADKDRLLFALAAHLPVLSGHRSFAQENSWFRYHIGAQLIMDFASPFLAAYTLMTLHKVSEPQFRIDVHYSPVSSLTTLADWLGLSKGLIGMVKCALKLPIWVTWIMVERGLSYSQHAAMRYLGTLPDIPKPFPTSVKD